MRWVTVFLTLAACGEFSESVGAAAPLGTVWQLVRVNDDPAEGRLSLVFVSGGGVRGALPCNTWRAEQTAPLPWFELSEFAATTRACDQAALERRYTALLQSMDLAEVAGDVMLLTAPDGQSLEFRAPTPE
ncbi:MAG: META domain-containing protein [Pseudomonadota bacterium]